MRKKIKSSNGRIYLYPGSVRVAKITPPGCRCTFYHVECCVQWNPEAWVTLECSDYLRLAILLAKCLSRVLCGSYEFRKQILKLKGN